MPNAASHAPPPVTVLSGWYCFGERQEWVCPFVRPSLKVVQFDSSENQNIPILVAGMRTVHRTTDALVILCCAMLDASTCQ